MKTVFIFYLLAFNIQLSAQQIVFDNLEINYGEIPKGDDGLRVFKFKNTGNSPLIISDIKRSCGCTTPEFTKEPIMPGEKGEIFVRYDTQRVGLFNKTLTVYSNDPINKSVQLKILGVIKDLQEIPSKEKSLFKN